MTTPSNHLLLIPIIAIWTLVDCATTGSRSSTPPSRLASTASMALVPEGSFMMGHEQGEDDERPAHEVTHKAFRMDRFEVTNADYEECVDAGVCGQAGSLSQSGLDGDKQPVVGVTWMDADRYCRWVGKRLPTEAEWERAARGTQGRLYPNGAKAGPSTANLRGSTDGHAMTSPVGSFPNGATPEDGIHDLAGNAAEWCSDGYDPTYYKKSIPWTNPQGPGYTEEKVVRGGSYLDSDYNARSTARSRMAVNLSSNTVGFRCAADE